MRGEGRAYVYAPLLYLLEAKIRIDHPAAIYKRGAQGARGVRTVAEVTSSLTAVRSPLLAYLDQTPSAIRKVMTFWPSGRTAVWTYGRLDVRSSSDAVVHPDKALEESGSGEKSLPLDVSHMSTSQAMTLPLHHDLVPRAQ